ncbi:MAG: NifU family protein [bacterium]
MIQIEDKAQQYFEKLLADQDMPDLSLRVEVKSAGTPAADCQLSFCETNQQRVSDIEQDCGSFKLYIAKESEPYLEDAAFQFSKDPTGGQLVIKAPNIKGSAPSDDAPLQERVQYVIDTEVIPMVASHGGMIHLINVSDGGDVDLKFGGGCQGCGMASMTLKNGVEKTLRERIPELGEIRDVTDHDTGENPYFT